MEVKEVREDREVEVWCSCLSISNPGADGPSKMSQHKIIGEDLQQPVSEWGLLWGGWVYLGKAAPFGESRSWGRIQLWLSTSKSSSSWGNEPQYRRVGLSSIPQYPLQAQNNYLLSLNSCWVPPQKFEYELCPGFHICHYVNHPRNILVQTLCLDIKESNLVSKWWLKPFNGFLSLKTTQCLSQLQCTPREKGGILALAHLDKCRSNMIEWKE